MTVATDTRQAGVWHEALAYTGPRLTSSEGLLVLLFIRMLQESRDVREEGTA